MFTIEDVECIAACTEAPCIQVNYRFGMRLTTDDLDDIIAALRAGNTPEKLITANPGEPIPSHGTLGLARQHMTEEQTAHIIAPELVNEAPVWLTAAAKDS